METLTDQRFKIKIKFEVNIEIHSHTVNDEKGNNLIF